MLKDLALSSKKSLFGLFLVIIASAIVTSATYAYREKAEEEASVANRNLQNEIAKYRLAKKNSEILAVYKDKFENLKAKGIGSTEDRLSWINAIESAVNKKLITAVDYQIEKQIKHNEQALAATYPDIEIYRSVMTLDMEMLHEGDLYSFFNELNRLSKGMFEIQSCDLISKLRDTSSVLNSKTDRNYGARCRLNWYSIQSKRFKL